MHQTILLETIAILRVGQAASSYPQAFQTGPCPFQVQGPTKRPYRPPAHHLYYSFSLRFLDQSPWTIQLHIVYFRKLPRICPFASRAYLVARLVCTRYHKEARANTDPAPSPAWLSDQDVCHSSFMLRGWTLGFKQDSAPSHILLALRPRASQHHGFHHTLHLPVVRWPCIHLITCYSADLTLVSIPPGSKL